MGGLVLLIIGVILAVIGFGLFIYSKSIIKTFEEPLSFKSRLFRLFAVGTALLGVGLMLTYWGIIIWQDVMAHSGYRAMAIIAGLLTGISFGVFISGFSVHFFVKEPGKAAKPAKFAGIFGGIATLLFIFMSLDAFTLLEAIGYPLVYKIPASGDGGVHFYALFILGGALLAWFVVEQFYSRKYGKKGLIENMFYLCLIVGILGARIWYVIGNWNRLGSGFPEDPLSMFYFWDGGLTIIGGLIFGALAGIIFWSVRRKEYPRLEVADIVLPAILLAQAVGRWGNFFNQEVYGAATETWTFLPLFIQKQMTINGSFRVPLFLVESLLNIAGYFVIRYGIGRGLKKYILDGDQGFSYFIWYGVVRSIMEPLRDPRFNMGANNQWSFIWAIVFIAIGVIGIIANHLWHHFKPEQWTRLFVTPNYGKKVEADDLIKVKSLEDENGAESSNEEVIEQEEVEKGE